MTSGSSRAAPTSQDKTRSTNRPKPAPKFKPRAPHARVSAKSALLGLLVLVVAAAVGVRCLLHSGDDGALPASHPTSPAPRTSASLQSLARRIEREAKQRPADPSIATETAGAFVAFGDVLKGTRWYVEALRRQVRLAGGTASQLEAVEGYGPLHLSLHLELHAIQLARQLLRTPAHARADYVRQIEARCSGPTPLTEQMVIALRSPLGVPRRLLAGALAHCAHSQSAMAELATKHNGAIRMQMGPNGLFHLLAHFGDVVLIHDAIAALPTKEVATQMQSRATLAQATPIQIAENRGHAAAAAALRTVMGDKGAAGDAGGGSVATDTGGGSDNTEGGSADTGGGWVRVTPPLQMSEAQRGALAEAEADHGGWGGSDTERRARPATADIKGGSQPSAAVSGGAGDAYLDDCEIDVLHLDSLSPAAFASVFYSRERPVLVRNGSAPHWGSLRSLLSVGELTRRYGEIGVRVSANPYHDDQEARKTSIAEFAAQVVAGTANGRYLFESLPPSPLRSSLEPHLPSYITPALGSGWTDQHSVQLAIGDTGTGAPAHYHKAAVNTLIYGRKRWWLWPPAGAQYSAMPVGEWVAAGGPQAAAADGRPTLSCVQRAGDVLYLPDFWGHAVLNEKPSVAVATEILTQRLQFFFAG